MDNNNENENENNDNTTTVVQNLLNKLRTSQVWHKLQQEQQQQQQQQQQHHHRHQHQTSVASLLSQLATSTSTSTNTDTSIGTDISTDINPASPDLRSCTFQQALPHLARLPHDPAFVATITSMKGEQDELEKRLSNERDAIQRSHHAKVAKARTKATMIGVGLTKYEADAMSQSFRRDLYKFDLERALPAWDSLLTKQQSELENLGVPSMFPSTDPSVQERQHRIIHVLIGLTSN